MKEQDTQRKIIKFLEKENWIVIKTIVLSKSGIPDIIAFKNGKTIFIEVKSKGKKPSKLQEYKIKQLRENGFTCLVVDEFNEEFLISAIQ